MKASCIDYKETNSFSGTLLSYLSEDERLRPYISCWPRLENFGSLIADRTQVDREVLTSALLKQYGDSRYQKADSAAVIANIRLLQADNTFTVTTGHQLNIFTGPLYFIFKIVSAINLAKDLKAAYPDKDFVPVYWMATEDHDFAEINHTRLHGKKFVWESSQQGATGRMNPATIESTLREYSGLLGLSENANALKAMLEEAYLRHSTLADATRYLVNQLFGKYGLVVVDADDQNLKRLFSPVIKKDLIEQRSYSAITETSSKLATAGFKTQVHAREINFFYLLDNFRERIVFENGEWHVLNSQIKFNQEALELEIESHPERFSPNVVMRPVYQEIILPNLAYIGGGAEIVYWLQLKQNFDNYGLSFPALIPRNSALIADDSLSPKLKRLSLSISDIFQDTDTLKKQWVLKNSEHNLSLSGEWEEFAALFERLKLRSSKIDPTLEPSADAVKSRLKRAMTNLEQKLIKAEKRNHEGALAQLENLRNKYFPNGSLQERTENFGLFYTKAGQSFIDELVYHLKPLDFKFTVLEF